MDKVAPQLFRSDPQISMPEKLYGPDPFVIEDLLDFPDDDDGYPEPEMAMAVTSTDSSAANDSCNSLFSAQEPLGAHFTTEFCVPYEDLAELEWVSNFVEEESFSSEDLRKLQLIQGIEPRAGPTLRPEVYSVPARARGKRSRANPGNWASGLPAPEKEPGEGRRCVHCATGKTPQWRTGPMGPKTLCNACGVRYKSGRLVPEYRPASSPTFVPTKHSNSHRKVVELRRQKETVQQQQQQFMIMNRNI